MKLKNKGPFDKQIVALEWTQYGESQGWHNGIFHGTTANHFGFSLHPDDESMQRYIEADKKNCELRLEAEDYTFDEAEKRFPSHHFNDIEPRIEKHIPLFVSKDIREFIVKQGDGIFIDADGKYSNFYQFLLGQYRETHND